MWPGCDDLEVSTNSFASYEARLAQLERSRHNAACCCGHIHNDVDIRASPNRPQEEPKRNSMEPDTDTVLPLVEKTSTKRKCHHEFMDDSSRIVLLSKDDILLYVDKDLLSTYR